MNRVLAIVGMAGAGKSIAAEYLHNNKGYPIVHFGGVITDEVKRRDLETIQANERLVREELRVKYGMDVVAKLSIPKIFYFTRDIMLS